MIKSAKRLKKQAYKMNYYDEIKIHDESKLCKRFFDKYRSHLSLGSRGFGYWCWKPQIILQLLNEIEENDYLQYTDIGCHLNPNGIDRLDYYFKMAQASRTGVFAFKSIAPKYPLIHDGRRLLDLDEYKWTKGDLFDYFNVRENKKITHTQSYGATNLFLKKSEKSVKFIEKWLDVINFNFSLIDDSCSKSPNLPGFIEHRHDQSIFSILCKVNNIPYVSSYEYWYPSLNNPYKPDWKLLKNFPIHKKRDKNTGIVDSVKELLKKVKRKILKYDFGY